MGGSSAVADGTTHTSRVGCVTNATVCLREALSQDPPDVCTVFIAQHASSVTSAFAHVGIATCPEPHRCSWRRLSLQLQANVAYRMQLSHAVLLAGGVGKSLHPLTSSGTPKALLSVGNQALISFPLRTLEQGGVTHTIVVRRSLLCFLA